MATRGTLILHPLQARALDEVGPSTVCAYRIHRISGEVDIVVECNGRQKRLGIRHVKSIPPSPQTVSDILGEASMITVSPAILDRWLREYCTQPDREPHPIVKKVWTLLENGDVDGLPQCIVEMWPNYKDVYQQRKG